MEFNADEKCAKHLAELEPPEWIRKMVEQYQTTGQVDMESLIRLLGDPAGSVSISDPTAAVRESLTVVPSVALAK